MQSKPVFSNQLQESQTHFTKCSKHTGLTWRAEMSKRDTTLGGGHVSSSSVADSACINSWQSWKHITLFSHSPFTNGLVDNDNTPTTLSKSTETKIILFICTYFSQSWQYNCIFFQIHRTVQLHLNKSLMATHICLFPNPQKLKSSCSFTPEAVIDGNAPTPLSTSTET